VQGRDDTGNPGVRGGSSPLIAAVLSIFSSRGFRIANYSDVRGCVDFVAVRDGNGYVVRVLSNVDALREESVEEFVRLADLLGAIPIIVGERTKRDTLKDGIIYRRYGVPVVTSSTLARIIDGDIPSSEVYNGRVLVYFNPDSFRAARQSLGLSQNDLAQRIGTTKDSIYRYEHGYPALEPVARRIVSVLGADVLAPVRLYDSSNRREHGNGVFQFRRAPWDIFVAGAKRVALSAARGVVKRKVELLQRGEGVVHDYYAMIVASRVRISFSGNVRVPVLSEEELRELKRPRDIVKRLEEEFE